MLEKYNVKPKKFFLVSLHRQENVDNPKRFSDIIKGLKQIGEKYDFPVVFPIHPRSEKMIKKLKINLEELKVIKPVDYFSFLHLEKNARLVLTDSGGVQEECCIVKTPCVTLRNNTERPETVVVKANIVSGINSQDILKCANKMIKSKQSWKNPYGNGTSAKKIIDILRLNL